MLGAAGCGDSGSPDVASAPPPEPAKPEDFPKADGKTLRGLLESFGSSGPVIAASVSQFKPGENRFGFALFDRAAAQIADAPVVLYLAPVKGGPGQQRHPMRPLSAAREADAPFGRDVPAEPR